MKRTPLFPAYKDTAKLISFHGWEMPLQFSGILNEHAAVRNQAGLFDVSHMGEIEVTGSDALSLVQQLTTNDASKLGIGDVQYSVMCYADGGTVDDLLVYRTDENRYLLVVNASNIEKDEAWVMQHRQGDVKVSNLSNQMAQLALQGPLAERILGCLTSLDLSMLKPFTFQSDVSIGGTLVLISRTGYTGEDGFELYLDATKAVDLWTQLLEAGEEEGLLPCGLGARDTLRFEAALPLYGQELSSSISPLEAGIGFVVKFDKENFIGKEALLKQKEAPCRRRVGLEMMDRGIPRSHYKVYQDGKWIGEVTSGTYAPTLKKNLGLAHLTCPVSQGDLVHVEIRGKECQAKVVKTPFYRRERKKEVVK